MSPSYPHDHSRTGPVHPRSVFAAFLALHLILGGAVGGLLGSDGAIVGAGAHGALMLFALIAGVLSLVLKSKPILYIYMVVASLWIIFGLIHILFMLNVFTLVSSGKESWVSNSVANYYIATGASGWVPATSTPSGNSSAAAAALLAANTATVNAPFILNSCPAIIGLCLEFLGFGLAAAFFLPIATLEVTDSNVKGSEGYVSDTVVKIGGAAPVVPKSPTPPEYSTADHNPASASSRTMALLEGADPDSPRSRPPPNDPFGRSNNYNNGPAGFRENEQDSYSRNKFGTGGTAGGQSNYGSQTRLVNNGGNDYDDEDASWSRSRQQQPQQSQHQRPGNNYSADRNRVNTAPRGNIYDDDGVGTLRMNNKVPAHMASRARDTLYTVNGGDDDMNSDYGQSMGRNARAGGVNNSNQNSHNRSPYNNNSSSAGSGGRAGFNNGNDYGSPQLTPPPRGGAKVNGSGPRDAAFGVGGAAAAAAVAAGRAAAQYPPSGRERDFDRDDRDDSWTQSNNATAARGTTAGGNNASSAAPRSPPYQQSQQPAAVSRRDRPDRDLPPFSPALVTPSTAGSGNSGGGGGGGSVKKEPKVRCRTCGEKMLLSLSSTHVCPDGSVPAEKYGTGSGGGSGNAASAVTAAPKYQPPAAAGYDTRDRENRDRDPNRYNNSSDRYNNRDANWRDNSGKSDDDVRWGVDDAEGDRYGGEYGSRRRNDPQPPAVREERPAPGKRMRVTKRYAPKLDDEVHLEVGDYVKIEEVFEDGWGAGYNGLSYL